MGKMNVDLRKFEATNRPVGVSSKKLSGACIRESSIWSRKFESRQQKEAKGDYPQNHGGVLHFSMHNIPILL